MLKVEGLTCRYGKVEAVRDLTIEVRRGELVSLIGANGAGKTTTLKAISGVLAPAAGRIAFLGEDITRASARRILELGIAHCPEGRRVFPHMTVAENLEMGCYLRRDSAGIATDLEQLYARFPILAERRQQPAGTLSGGEQQMLAMGRALMGAPKLLMLDEPSLGLAPIIVADIFRTIGELRAAGVSVLLVEQNAKAALQIADRAYVMELGEFILSGSAKDIAANQRVAASYLGFQHEGASQV